ncbi:MAG: amidohydrolase, partial [Acidimicrobiales bacterium]
MSEDRYLLISSDGHTGPPADHYREYLDEAYHPQFDAHQAELGVIREFQQSMNQDFRKEWEAKTG